MQPRRRPIAGGAQAPSAAELRACIGDLMSLIALPALTGGSDPAGILRRFCEALGSLLPLRFCIASSQAFDGGEATVMQWLPGSACDAPVDPQWLEYCRSCVVVEGTQPLVGHESTPCGRLRVVRLAMGYGAETGTLTAGAERTDFPSLTEAAILRAAASLAAGRLKAARLVHEREQASRVKDEFLAMLGHELRNPLAPIVTALDLMHLRGSDKTEREQQIIRRQVDHLIRLVDDLMDVSRITRGKVELRQATVEIGSVLRHAIEMASLLLERRGHRLSVDAPAAGLRWTGDPMRLAQVVANLLTNAARYTEPGGDIRLVARRDGGDVVIGVSDNGIGMAADLVPRVFDMFYQGSRTPDRAEGGLGLGLALVKSLVQMHGGRVEARSAGLGKGSEFVVRLPLPADDTAAAATAGADVAPTRNRLAAAPGARILLVDDNVDAADAMADALEAGGHRVMVAYDPVAALRRCTEFAPELAVLDIGMPVMDGYELALRMRELPAMRDVPMIAMSGYGRVGGDPRPTAAGFAEHLVKPVEPDSLLALIGRLTAPVVEPR